MFLLTFTNQSYKNRRKCSSEVPILKCRFVIPVSSYMPLKIKHIIHTCEDGIFTLRSWPMYYHMQTNEFMHK